MRIALCVIMAVMFCGVASAVDVMVVNVQKVVTESEMGKKMSADLAEVSKVRQAAVDLAQKDLKEAQAKLDNSTQDEIVANQRIVVDLDLKLRRMVEDGRAELDSRQRALFADIEKVILRCVTKFSEGSVIVNSQNVLYIPESSDLTQEIISCVDAPE